MRSGISRKLRFMPVFLVALSLGIGYCQASALATDHLQIAEVNKPKLKGKVSRDIMEADDLLSKGDW